LDVKTHNLITPDEKTPLNISFIQLSESSFEIKINQDINITENITAASPLRVEFYLQNPSTPKTTDLIVSLLYTDAPMLLSYKMETSAFSVNVLTSYDLFEVLVAWEETQTDVIGLYEPPSGCYQDLCTITNAVTV